MALSMHVEGENLQLVVVESGMIVEGVMWRGE